MVNEIHPSPGFDPVQANLLCTDQEAYTRIGKLIGVALLLHAVLFFIPFPKGAAAPPPLLPKPGSPNIRPPVIVPPAPLPEPPQPPDRSDPVPVPIAEEQDPVPIHENDWIEDIDFVDSSGPLLTGFAAVPPSPRNAVDEFFPGVVKAIPISTPDPVYPEAARRMNVTGVVELSIVITDKGRIRDIKVLRSAPLGMTESAVAAVRTWVYSPAILNGRPVSVRKRVIITFEMQ